MFCCTSASWAKLRNTELAPTSADHTEFLVGLSVPEACREIKNFKKGAHAQFFTQGSTPSGRVFFLDLDLQVNKTALLYLKSSTNSRSKDNDEMRIVDDDNQYYISADLALSDLVVFKGKYTIGKVTQDKTTRSLTFQLMVAEDSALKFSTNDSTKELSAGQELRTLTIIPRIKREK